MFPTGPDVFGAFLTIQGETGKEDFSFRPWEEFEIAPYEYNPDQPYFNILVPTVETIRFYFY